MVSSDLVLASLVALQVFALLSTIDGLYVHLWRLQLHRRPASYREHLWHTARALLFAPVVAIEAFFLFGEPMTLPMIVGTVIVVAGVYMVNRKA